LPLWGPSRLERALAAAGARLDRELARRSNGVVALCNDAAAALRTDASGPFARIPPGLARRPTPSAAEQQRACGRFHLEPGRFVLYSGNLERYQGLDFLGEVAALAPELDVVVATHGRGSTLHPALRVIRVVDRDEMRALAFAAQVGVVPRRAVGGFPIKLLGYMEASLPIVAFAGVADGLRHDVSAVLLAHDASPNAFAAAICGLVREPQHARRLGDAARARLEAVHDWGVIGAQTAAFAQRVRDASTR
jgi:glycosyltransferase involved in cell wall biosynthesis